MTSGRMSCCRPSYHYCHSTPNAKQQYVYGKQRLDKDMLVDCHNMVTPMFDPGRENQTLDCFSWYSRQWTNKAATVRVRIVSTWTSAICLHNVSSGQGSWGGEL